MNPIIVRVLVYMVIAFACYGVAILFAPEGVWFAVIFGAGLLIAIAAELLLLRHVVRQTVRRFTA